MLNLNHLRSLDLKGLTITAQINPDGSLGPVGGLFAKMWVAARDADFPLTRMVVVATDQDLKAEGIDLTPVRLDVSQQVFKDHDREIHVIKARALDEAVELLHLVQDKFWGKIEETLPELPEFVGRQRLLTEIEKWKQHTASGYLILVGGMGLGKTTLLAKLVHDARYQALHGEPRKDPIFHFIDYHPHSTGEPGTICQQFYHQLRRKYRLPEHGGKSIEVKLEHLLSAISRQLPNGEKEVLLLDAADQVEPGTVLLPQVLRRLPRGILCIITSRPDQRWKQECLDTEEWLVEDFLDARQDAAALLRMRGQRLTAPLAVELIERIEHAETLPVMYTLDKCLSKLEYPERSFASEEQLQDLRSSSEAWLASPETLVNRELDLCLHDLENQGISREQTVRTLGTLALAREHCSQPILRQLGLWREGLTDKVLERARNLFKPMTRDQRMYLFDHPGIRRVIFAKLEEMDATQDQHARLADGCLRRYSDTESVAYPYALRHVIQHLLGAKRWNDVERLLTNLDFVNAKRQRLLETPLGDCTVISSWWQLGRDYTDALDAWPRQETQQAAICQRTKKLSQKR